MIVQCKDCHSRSFAAVVGESSSSIDTESLIGFRSDGSIEITFEMDADMFDMGAPEVESSESAEAVDVDDLLEMHDFLQSFDGDFETLFRDIPKG